MQQVSKQGRVGGGGGVQGSGSNSALPPGRNPSVLPTSTLWPQGWKLLSQLPPTLCICAPCSCNGERRFPSLGHVLCKERVEYVCLHPSPVHSAWHKITICCVNEKHSLPLWRLWGRGPGVEKEHPSFCNIFFKKIVVKYT